MSSRSILFVSLFSITVIIAVALPFYVVHAAPLVPCGLSQDDPSTPYDETRQCQFCDFFQLIDNIKNFLLVDVMTPVAVLLIVVGGIMVLTGGAKPGNIAQGKRIITDTMIGVFVIFSAWMITNTIIQLFTGDSNLSQSWYKISCNINSNGNGGPGIGGTPTPVVTPGKTPTPAPTLPSTGGALLTCSGTDPIRHILRTATCSDCKPVQYGYPRNQGPSTDSAAASLADFINGRLSPALKAAGIPSPYYHDGICPNYWGHASPAHYTGHAMDIDGKDMATTEKICKILNDLGLHKHEPGTGYLGNTTNVYIIESRSPRDTNPNSACPKNSPGGHGIHIQY